MNLRARITGLGLLAGVFGMVLALNSWNPSVAVAGSPAGVSGQSDRSNVHPEIRRSLKSLRMARHELQEAKHDFGGHREAAIRAVDEAIRQLEICLQASHSGDGSQSRNHGHLSSGS